MKAIVPESIDLFSLPSLPLEGRKALPKCPGIYFVLSVNDEVLYIGRSTNIAQRWLFDHRQRQLQQMHGIRLGSC